MTRLTGSTSLLLRARRLASSYIHASTVPLYRDFSYGRILASLHTWFSITAETDTSGCTQELRGSGGDGAGHWGQWWEGQGGGWGGWSTLPSVKLLWWRLDLYQGSAILPSAISCKNIQEITRLALSCSMPWTANTYGTGWIYRKTLRKFRPQSRKCIRNNLMKSSST